MKSQPLFVKNSASLAAILLFLIACKPALSPEELKAREDKSLNFCKTVADVITPEDKMCGRFYNRVKQELAAEKEKAIANKKAEVEAALVPRESIFSPWGGKVSWRWGAQGSGPGCIGDNSCMWVEVKPNIGCSHLYVSASLLNSEGQNIGFANDSTQDVGAGEVAILTLSTSESIQSMRISEINCT